MFSQLFWNDGAYCVMAVGRSFKVQAHQRFGIPGTSPSAQRTSLTGWLAAARTQSAIFLPSCPARAFLVPAPLFGRKHWIFLIA